MVRGNWQKRVERTEARRAANKAQKEQRRAKRLSSQNDDKAQRAIWFRLLSEWLDDTDFFPPPDPGNESEQKYSLVVDLWTDARPKTRQEYLPVSSSSYSSSHDINSDDDYFEEDDGRNNKSSRSKHKVKDRGGFKKTKGKKKAHHPNSKRKTDEEDVVKKMENQRSNSIHVTDERLCAKEFFYGQEKCPAGKILLQQRSKGSKRGNETKHDTSSACSLSHYHQFPKVKGKQNSPPLTLAQVVNGKYQSHPNNCDAKPLSALPLKVREATLKYAFNAMFGVDEDVGDDDGVVGISEPIMSIEGIYHTRIIVTGTSNDRETDNDSDDNDEKLDQRSVVLEELEKVLDQEKISQTSLIYLTIQGVLVYDLHRGGLVFSETEEDFLVAGEPIDVDKFLEYNAVGVIQPSGPSHIHEQLTHHVLDDILSYLPDAAVAVLPQVCKSWRDEVGTKSPLLWKMLLKRHKWLDSISSKADIDNDDVYGLGAFKKAFISHYVAARDIRAIVSACSQVCGGSKGFYSSVVDSDFAMQRYKSTAGAPMFEDDLLLMLQFQIGAWTENKYEEKVRARALAVYPDLTIRLFEVVSRNSTSGSQSSSAVTPTKCRQIACIGVLPTSLTQKKSSCHFRSLAIDEDDVCWMFTIPNDNDLGQKTSSLLSVVSRDDLVCAGNEGLLDDHSMHQFDLRAMVLDFLLSGAIDDTHQDHLQTALHDYLAIRDGETSLIEIAFSSDIVSCGKGHFLAEAYINIPLDPESEDEDGDDERSQSSGNQLFVISIKKGKAQIVKAMHLGSYGPDKLKILASEPYKLHLDTKNSSSGRKTCTNLLVISNGEGLNLSLTISKNGEIDMQMKSVIDRHQFFQDLQHMEAVVTSLRAVAVTISPVDTRLIFFCDGGYEIHPIGGPSSKLFDVFCIREEYVAVILGIPQSDGENDDDAIGGEWFGIEEDSAREVVVYHITSRQEVFRYPLPDVSLNVRCVGNTIAANISNLGFVIAGENAREVARKALEGNDETLQTPTKTTKVKKKRLASLASGRKKDGFARGMSMRG